ncbi:OmpA family protein [Bryobacter aggregatus]|uniref:OmpA family protein n=1 Tax=Bryobacter aggregatus TaxID=360054 RepID=UPI00138E4A97|nr:OmpA family protein [Bryobacter aggregatus]
MNSLFRTTSIAALALAPFITGCATKKYVKTTVTPINQKVGELDATTQAQAKSIEEAERGIARADERAQGAEGKADAAQKDATLARKEAADGRALAEQGLTRADQLGKDMNAMNSTMNTRFENMQNFKLANTDQVLFRINQSELDKDGMASIDNSIGKVTEKKNYVVEIQGFTDSTGNKAANIELSKKRADAVVRYLTTKHNIPLHRIFVAGYGAENGVADNKTRDGRKQNRRVEMKVFVSADQAGTQTTASAN